VFAYFVVVLNHRAVVLVHRGVVSVPPVVIQCRWRLEPLECPTRAVGWCVHYYFHNRSTRQRPTPQLTGYCSFYFHTVRQYIVICIKTIHQYILGINGRFFSKTGISLNIYTNKRLWFNYVLQRQWTHPTAHILYILKY
jgi:hypothetical protein